MADTFRIKRRAVGGAAGAPASLAASEIAYNEQDDTLYYGKGNNGGGVATSVLPVAGIGAFAPKASPVLTGTVTASYGGGNNLLIEGRPSAQNVWLYANGVDANVGIAYATKAAGAHLFYTGSFGNIQAAILHQTVAGYLQVAGGDGVNLSMSTGGDVTIANANLTGNARAPTPTAGDNDTSVATTAFVTAAVAAGGGGGGGASVTISDTAPASPTSGAMWWESDTGTFYIYYVDANTSQWVAVNGQASALAAPVNSPVFTGDPQAPTATPGDNDTSVATTAFVQTALAAGAFAGMVVNSAYAEYTTWTGTSARIATGIDTIPQQTDGFQIVTATITPRSATNKLRIRAVIPWSCNYTSQVWFALFKDSAAPAIATTSQHPIGNGYAMIGVVEVEIVAGTALPTTIKLRFGTYDGTFSAYVNGVPSQRLWGGSMRVVLEILEIKV